MENKETKARLKRGLWKPEEDLLLKKYVETHGEGNWATVSQKSGVMRSGKSCRLRWKNYLRPNIKRGSMSDQEKDLIIRLHKLLGNRWSLIAGRLPGRTDNEVKNYWNTHLNKRISPVPKATKIDPNTRDIKLTESPANSSQPSYSSPKKKKSSCEGKGLEGGKEEGRNKDDSELFNYEVITSSLFAPNNNAPFWFDDDDDHIIPILDSFLLF